MLQVLWDKLTGKEEEGDEFQGQAFFGGQLFFLAPARRVETHLLHTHPVAYVRRPFKDYDSGRIIGGNGPTNCLES